MKANTSFQGEEKIAKGMKFKKMQGVEQCFPHSVQVTSKGFSKYLFHGEDTVWNQLSSCLHAAVPEIGEASKDLETLQGRPGMTRQPPRFMEARPGAHPGSHSGWSGLREVRPLVWIDLCSHLQKKICCSPHTSHLRNRVIAGVTS